MTVLRYSFCVLFLFTYGCSGAPDDRPDLGKVTGTIKMDGDPVPNAIVIFQPQGARPSGAQTDENGHYELIYVKGVKGAAIGKHIISISTHSEGDADQDIAAQKETIPSQYNSSSEETREVKEGSQVIDFDLSSDGEIEVLDDSIEDEE